MVVGGCWVSCELLNAVLAVEKHAESARGQAHNGSFGACEKV